MTSKSIESTLSTQELLKEIISTLNELCQAVQSTKQGTESMQKDIADISFRIESMTITGIEIKLGNHDGGSNQDEE